MEKNLTVEMLNQLKERIGEGNEHINGSNSYISLSEWEELGRPYHWEIVEEKYDYKVALDSAYGHIALFKNDSLLDVTSRTIILEDIVVLDKDYYSTSKYIWL